jgi:uncharacterized membrane protein YdbT with pleckstrin-like domain
MNAPASSKKVYRHIKIAIYINLLLIVLCLTLLLFKLLFWFGIVVEFVLVIGLIHAVIIHFTEYITLEDHCANVHTGLIFVRNNRVPYTKMNSIDITNFLGFHNLEIDAGNDVSEIRFKWVEDAHKLKEALESKLMVNNYYQNSQNQERQPINNFVAPQPQYDPQHPQQFQQPQYPQQTPQQHMAQNIQELNQLAYLRSKGVITAQEFEEQKRKILAD